ncbi:MAG: 3-keto-disaccharide hydrolase [Planctomycetota bacterium]
MTCTLKRLIIFNALIAIALSMITGCSQQNTLNSPPGGFTTLFNGKDLTGWKRHEKLPGHGVAGKWTLENEAIIGIQDPPGKGGFLTTLQEFRDFELTLETKIDWPLDSGVFLRVGPNGKSHQVTLDYEEGGEIAGIYCPWTQNWVHHNPGGINHFMKDKWNKIRIICQGEPARIQVWIKRISGIKLELYARVNRRGSRFGLTETSLPISSIQQRPPPESPHQELSACRYIREEKDKRKAKRDSATYSFGNCKTNNPAKIRTFHKANYRSTAFAPNSPHQKSLGYLSERAA